MREAGLMPSVSGSAITSDLDVFSNSDTSYQNINNEKYSLHF